MDISLQDRYRGCLVGLACGDAVGTTFEFRERGTFLAMDMVGGGPFKLKAGQYTDDTSMALCLAQSIIQCNGFDPVDQMSKYVQWYKTGYMSSTGICFDIGMATVRSLEQFLDQVAQELSRTYPPKPLNPYCGSTHDGSSGNGSIMRLAPVVMWAYGYVENEDFLNYHDFVRHSSKTTHSSDKCINACAILANVITECFQNHSKSEIVQNAVSFGLLEIDPINKTIDDIRGSGYVVDSLEAALWCFFHTECYEAAILQAVNLGDDADTTAAVVGQIAGAFYGINGIPEKWRDTLQDCQMMIDMSDKLLKNRVGVSNEIVL